LVGLTSKAATALILTGYKHTLVIYKVSLLTHALGPIHEIGILRVASGVTGVIIDLHEAVGALEARL
jgi:hypothetical protein